MEKAEEKIITETHFNDGIDVQHLFDDADRLPGRDGKKGTGLKASEAVFLAEGWWDAKARFDMPDYNKEADQLVVSSALMRGLPWQHLNKQEKLRIVSQWYAHVGVHLIIDGMGTSEDHAVKDKKIDKLRDHGTDILPVLSDDRTHKKTHSLEEADRLEMETWKEGYDEIEREKKLLDAQGNVTKEANHGESKESGN